MSIVVVTSWPPEHQAGHPKVEGTAINDSAQMAYNNMVMDNKKNKLSQRYEPTIIMYDVPPPPGAMTYICHPIFIIYDVAHQPPKNNISGKNHQHTATTTSS